MQNTKPKSAKETKTQNQAMTTENERNPYMKIENQSQCETHVLINTKKKKKKVKTETRENLGEVDNEVSELGVQASLLLKPIGNGFANGFESEGSQLHHW